MASLFTLVAVLGPLMRTSRTKPPHFVYVFEMQHFLVCDINKVLFSNSVFIKRAVNFLFNQSIYRVTKVGVCPLCSSSVLGNHQTGSILFGLHSFLGLIRLQIWSDTYYDLNNYEDRIIQCLK